MDYASGTQLRKYQWHDIHNPRMVLDQEDEDGASIANCTWEKLKEYFLQTESYTRLIAKKKVYDKIFANFDKLMDKLGVNANADSDKMEEVENIEGWSVRTSTLSENKKGFLYERILKKLENSENDKEVTFNLAEKGIYLGKAVIEKEDYDIAIYSEKENTVIKKALLKDYCEFIDNEKVNKQIKVAEIGEYLLLAFFKDGKRELVVQFMSDDDEKFKKLLTAFKVLKGEEKFEEKEKKEETKLEIKEEQLAKVFKDTDSEILKEIVKTVNKYGGDFGIDTKDRISHFLAQTGYESTGFEAAKGESGCYKSTNTNGWKIWFSLTWKEPPFSNDYDESLNEFKRGTKKLKWTSLGCDSTNLTCVEVPLEYVCSKDNYTKGEALTNKLFSYVYQGEGGNGNSGSEDGYKYRGHGAIQLTWKKNYEAFDKWLQNNYNDNYKDVVANPKLIDENKDLFILSAMWFWKSNGLNKLSDKGSFDEITKKINANKEGKVHRLKYLNELKKYIK